MLSAREILKLSVLNVTQQELNNFPIFRTNNSETLNLKYKSIRKFWNKLYVSRNSGINFIQKKKQKENNSSNRLKTQVKNFSNSRKQSKALKIKKKQNIRTIYFDFQFSYI